MLICMGSVAPPILDPPAVRAEPPPLSQVTAISAVDDYFRGVTYVRHNYSNPTGDRGAPWEAVFLGCCRLEDLTNDANTAFRLTATIDLTQSSGSIAVRSPGVVTVPEVTVATAPQCLIPGDNLNQPGSCFKIHGTTLECGNHVSPIGLSDKYSFRLSSATSADADLDLSAQENPQLAVAGGGNGVAMGRDGSVRMLCALGTCLSAGRHNVRAAVMEDRIAYVKIINPGSGCTAGILTAACPACQAPGGQQFRARWTVANGSVDEVIIENGGSGYYGIPDSSILQGVCPGFQWELVALQTELSFLVRVQPRHRCYLSTTGADSPCNPAIANVMYAGSPTPSIDVGSFPGLGNGYDAVRQVIVPNTIGTHAINGGTLLQDAVGHVQAYAGYEVSMTFKAGVNWCLNNVEQQFFLPGLDVDPRCVVPEADVSIDFGPLPDGTQFASFEQDAIAELMITFDNPFSSHRPGHEWAVARGQREYTGMPGAAEASMLNFTRIPQNLNSGVGGASVYLWYRRYSGLKEGEEAITDIKVSASAADEERLTLQGYNRLAGNLNEQAGGNEVYIWYKKSSGGHKYDPTRPSEDGFAVGITEIAFSDATAPTVYMSSTADANPYANGTQLGAASEWHSVDTNLNSGIPGSPTVQLFFRKGTANPFSQMITWRPCDCDVGRTYICATARSSLDSGLGFGASTGNTSCVAVDVMPDIAPVIRSPTVTVDSSGVTHHETFELFMGRERRVPVITAVHNPHKHITFTATDLPPGAHLASVNVSEVVVPLDEGCVEGPCSHRVMDVRWTPSWNQGGLSTTVCVQAEGEATGCHAHASGMASTVCFILRVHKCTYALQYDQHLEEVAAMYHTDWLNIFSLNPSVTAPDRIQYSQQIINIGHKYVVVPGDTLSKISTVRF